MAFYSSLSKNPIPEIQKKASVGGAILLEDLLQAQIISFDQAEIVQFEQEKKAHCSLEEILLRSGFVSERALADFKATSRGHKVFCPDSTLIQSDGVLYLTKDMAQKHTIVLVDRFVNENGQTEVTVATDDPDNLPGLDHVRSLFKNTLIQGVLIGTKSDILSTIDRTYGYTLELDDILAEIESMTLDKLSSTHVSNPVARFLNSLTIHACKKKASDIHFEPEAQFIRIRYRIDGILRLIKTIHKSYWPPLLTRLKLLASMDISESQVPQNGRYSLYVGAREVDFRLSTQPTAHGENVVLRILDRGHSLMTLNKLGFGEEKIRLLKKALQKPSGIILFTGPTGSGKTTSLYSIFDYMNSAELNIMTLEEPIEYKLPWIRQTEIRAEGKISYSDGIRAILRQDPDVIFVGEMRDEETAKMALRAALTGHQVFSTLHTNDAIGTIYRLFDLGIEPSMLSGNMICSISQRLLRKICQNCSMEQHVFQAKEDENIVHLHPTYVGEGCQHCEYTGYAGRTAALEILNITEELDDLISRKAPRHLFKEEALRQGFITIRQHARQLVIDGVTSIEEYERVLGHYNDV